MNPSGTLFAGLGVSQVADIITWLSTWPIQAPPQNVSLALAALAVAAAHFAVDQFNKRFPAKTDAPVVAPVVAPAPAAPAPAAP